VRDKKSTTQSIHLARNTQLTVDRPSGGGLQEAAINQQRGGGVAYSTKTVNGRPSGFKRRMPELEDAWLTVGVSMATCKSKDARGRIPRAKSQTERSVAKPVTMRAITLTILADLHRTQSGVKGLSRV